ncbi:hypothetical protein MSIMFI_04752 [Mycobacterium simulans]|nr:hypothetical protein MSIMFI_04752 [Mycobacterium simulans]
MQPARPQDTLAGRLRCLISTRAGALFLTEICWASCVVGSGLDITTNSATSSRPPLRSIRRNVGRYERFALLRDNAENVAE